MELELGLALPYHNPSPNHMMIQEGGAGDDEEMEMYCHQDKPVARTLLSKHVKVKMEGVGIGRKVDLRKCSSYHALTLTLFHMFAKYSTLERNWEDYSLLYQDKDGDWMLLGEDDDHVQVQVQWELFVESVQRIHIINNGNNNNNNNNNNMGFRLLSHK